MMVPAFFLPSSGRWQIRKTYVTMYNEETQHAFVVPNSETPAFKNVIVIYLLSGFLLVILGSFFQRVHLLSGLVVSEIAFVLAPAVIYTVRHHYNFSRTFHIVPIRLKTVFMTIVTMFAAFVLVGAIVAVQEILVPRSIGYQEIWEDVLRQFHQVPLVVTLFLIAILPGVCEELLFRGFLLHGIRKKTSDLPAIIIVGVLFGAFHLDPYRFLPVTLLGIIFGYMVVKTGSIFTGIVAHSTNNTISILLSYAAQTVTNSDVPFSAQPEEVLTPHTFLLLFPIIIVALVVFSVGLRALPRVARYDGPDRQKKYELFPDDHDSDQYEIENGSHEK
jgi:membrane protease YdiL (CAAX protease family)